MPLPISIESNKQTLTIFSHTDALYIELPFRICYFAKFSNTKHHMSCTLIEILVISTCNLNLKLLAVLDYFRKVIRIRRICAKPP